MPTIDMQIAMTVTVPDAAGVEHEVELTEGLNDVPVEVAEHWYVRKFMNPMPAAPRVVLPSTARPAFLSQQAVANMADALAATDAASANAAGEELTASAGDGADVSPATPKKPKG